MFKQVGILAPKAMKSNVFHRQSLRQSLADETGSAKQQYIIAAHESHSSKCR